MYLFRLVDGRYKHNDEKRAPISPSCLNVSADPQKDKGLGVILRNLGLSGDELISLPPPPLRIVKCPSEKEQRLVHFRSFLFNQRNRGVCTRDGNVYASAQPPQRREPTKFDLKDNIHLPGMSPLKVGTPKSHFTVIVREGKVHMYTKCGYPIECFTFP